MSVIFIDMRFYFDYIYCKWDNKNMSKNETELSIPLDENQYEWVELPNKGECYPHKKGKVPIQKHCNAWLMREDFL